MSQTVAPPRSPTGLSEAALQTIVGAAANRPDLLTPSGYRVLRDSSAEELPTPDAIWEMFGSFQRMRERVAAVAPASSYYV